MDGLLMASLSVLPGGPGALPPVPGYVDAWQGATFSTSANSCSADSWDGGVGEGDELLSPHALYTPSCLSPDAAACGGHVAGCFGRSAAAAPFAGFTSAAAGAASTPLPPQLTLKVAARDATASDDDEHDEDEEGCCTPRAAIIPARSEPPPAPRVAKHSLPVLTPQQPGSSSPARAPWLIKPGAGAAAAMHGADGSSSSRVRAWLSAMELKLQLPPLPPAASTGDRGGSDSPHGVQRGAAAAADARAAATGCAPAFGADLVRLPRGAFAGNDSASSGGLAHLFAGVLPLLPAAHHKRGAETLAANAGGDTPAAMGDALDAPGSAWGDKRRRCSTTSSTVAFALGNGDGAADVPY